MPELYTTEASDTHTFMFQPQKMSFSTQLVLIRIANKTDTPVFATTYLKLLFFIKSVTRLKLLMSWLIVYH